jgi:hypothetical protein
VTDKEQEWIEKYRAALETEPPIKKSRLEGIRVGLKSLRTVVDAIANRISGEQSALPWATDPPGESPELDSAQMAEAVLERHRSPYRSNKAISAERSAPVAQQRRRAS